MRLQCCRRQVTSYVAGRSGSSGLQWAQAARDVCRFWLLRCADAGYHILEYKASAFRVYKHHYRPRVLRLEQASMIVLWDGTASEKVVTAEKPRSIDPRCGHQDADQTIMNHADGLLRHTSPLKESAECDLRHRYHARSAVCERHILFAVDEPRFRPIANLRSKPRPLTIKVSSSSRRKRGLEKRWQLVVLQHAIQQSTRCHSEAR